MESWTMFLLLAIIVGSLTSTAAQDGRCTKKVSRAVFYTETFTRTSTQTYYTKCGFLNFLRCTRYRTVYSVGSRRLSRIGYVSDYECCPGWITDGTNCLPTTPPTTKAVTTTIPSTTTQTTTSATPTTPPSTSRSTLSNSYNNGDIQPHARARTITATTNRSGTEPTSNYVGGPRESASLLSSRGMMMGISVTAVIVFLAMSIGGVVCGVRKLCPKKKPVERLQNESPLRRDSEAAVPINSILANSATGHGARPKPKHKVKGKPMATSNPSYDMMDLGEESSYEAINSEEGPLKTNKLSNDATGFECVGMSELMPAKRLHTSPGKCRRPSAPDVVIENEYTAFGDEVRTSPEPPHRNTAPKDHSNPAMGESTIGLRKPLPKPKPLPKARRNLQHVVSSSNTYAPPSASNHLVAPPTAATQYLDMSKGQSSLPTSADRRNCDKDGVSPKPVMTKFPSLEESPKSSSEDCTQGLRSIMSGPPSYIANLYDHVGESRSEPSSRRGSDAKHVFPTQGMYVQPGDLSPAVAKKSNHVTDENMTCTYVLGDQVPGLTPPRSPLFSDSYDLVGINGCSDPDVAHGSTNELRNPYDVVVTPENRRKNLKHVVTKSGYATPRKDTVDQDSYYENHRRSTASLPNSNRKLSLPVQTNGDEDVYDIVEVKDSMSKTTGRPPKVPLKKPLTAESQIAKTAIERSRSGPSLLRYAELDSVYVNTSRF